MFIPDGSTSIYSPSSACSGCSKEIDLHGNGLLFHVALQVGYFRKGALTILVSGNVAGLWRDL